MASGLAKGQLQGFDRPLFVNIDYPFQPDPPRVTSEPPRHYNTFAARNPVGSYRRTFAVPEAWKGRPLFLTFDGVDSAFYVWVNGERVGYSEDSRTPAEFNITQYLVPGENVLAAEVYRYSDGSYLECQDFWRLSGIFRDVDLVSFPNLHIRDFQVHTDLDASYRDAELGIDVWVRNLGEASRPFTVHGQLFDDQGKVVADGLSASGAVGAGGEVTVRLNRTMADPPKWSAEVGIMISIPGLIGTTFADSYGVLLVSAFAFGFFLISVSPVSMQYAAEITQPTPEGTSNGLIQLFAQGSVIFVYVMEAMKSKDGTFTPSLLLAIGLLLVSVLLIWLMEEPKVETYME